MTEEMKYYTGNCITDLHTDTSISCNEEKCKQYIKPDGLNFCMSSVCPEKDCIYALVNKLHQKIDCLEQENNSLQAQLNNITVQSNNAITALEQENEELKEEVKQIGSDFIKKGDYARELEQENKEIRKQLLEDKILDEEIESLSREDAYRSALEEIREIINGHASPTACEYWGSYKNACEPCALRILNQVEDKIQNRINEVLNEN